MTQWDPFNKLSTLKPQRVDFLPYYDTNWTSVIFNDDKPQPDVLWINGNLRDTIISDVHDWGLREGKVTYSHPC